MVGSNLAPRAPARLLLLKCLIGTSPFSTFATPPPPPWSLNAQTQNYFYPDTPKNYQITQYDRPIAEHGEIVLPSGKKVCAQFPGTAAFYGQAGRCSRGHPRTYFAQYSSSGGGQASVGHPLILCVTSRSTECSFLLCVLLVSA